MGKGGFHSSIPSPPCLYRYTAAQSIIPLETKSHPRCALPLTDHATPSPPMMVEALVTFLYLSTSKGIAMTDAQVCQHFFDPKHAQPELKYVLKFITL